MCYNNSFHFHLLSFWSRTPQHCSEQKKQGIISDLNQSTMVEKSAKGKLLSIYRYNHTSAAP